MTVSKAPNFAVVGHHRVWESAVVKASDALEKTTPAYLPAQPTRPDAAYSQTFLAIWPTGIYSRSDPLVSGLLTRMEIEIEYAR